MTENALIVFVKNPVVGQVKTRLAADIGADKATEVYKKLLKITQQAVENTNAKVGIWYAGHPAKHDLWDAYTKHKQSDGDLGKRMCHAIEMSLNFASKVCIIGSDCPHITSEIINRAFEALTHNDVVIGPARDGGYYLIGMSRLHPAIFENIPWSSESVYSCTIDILQQLNLTYHLLPLLSDIDTLEDLHQTMPELLS